MSETDFNQLVFGETKFSDILEEIYKTAKKKEKQISELIQHLNDLVNTVTEAQIIIPLIKEFLDIDVKNDDIVVKMAAIIQRSITREKTGLNGEILGTGFSLTPEELKELEVLREEALKSSKHDLKIDIENIDKQIERKKEKDDIDNLIDEVQLNNHKTEEDKMLDEIKAELLGENFGR